MPMAAVCSTRTALVVACVLGLAAVASAGAREGTNEIVTSVEGKRAEADQSGDATLVANDAGGQPAGSQDVLGFRAFCDSWMQKLREREKYNTEHIKWEKRDGLVAGEHVAYGRDRTCVAREQPGKDPIGKITYREIRYRRQGATPAEALAAPGTIVEQSDVTEIFRHAKGRWQY